MKKIYQLFTTFIFGAALFAEQPFFLKNWLVPETIVWGAKNEVTPIEGISLNPGYDEYWLESLEVKPFEESQVDLPPYLLERNLASWNMTYEQILESFKASDEFDVYEDLVPVYDDYMPEKSVTFDDVIVAVAKQDPCFEIIFSFGELKSESEKNNVKPKLFKIKHYEQSGKMNPRIYWNDNTELEKDIIALSAYEIYTYGFVPTVFDCSVQREGVVIDFIGGYEDAKGTLKNYKFVRNREEYLKLLDEKSEWNIRSYDELKALVQKNPKKTPYEIADLNHRDVQDVPKMYFLREMNQKIERTDIEVDDLINKLAVLRLGVGAGYITREDALNRSRPYVEKILSLYSSYEDFIIHRMLYSGFSGSAYQGYTRSPAFLLDYYNKTKKDIVLDEIKFNGKNSSKKIKLSLKDIWYKPQTEDELYWFELSDKAGTYSYVDLKYLPLIEEGISRFGKLEILTKLIEKVRL